MLNNLNKYVSIVKCITYIYIKRPVYKVHGLTLLLRVGTLWRCDDGLLIRSISLDKRCTSYNAPPISRKRAADRSSLRNFLPRCSLFMVGKAQKSHGARSGLYGECSNGIPPIHFFQAENRIQFRFPPCNFWVLQTMKREFRGKKFRSDQRSAARFREVSGAL
jgi:hypothetical protein